MFLLKVRNLHHRIFRAQSYSVNLHHFCHDSSILYRNTTFGSTSKVIVSLKIKHGYTYCVGKYFVKLFSSYNKNKEHTEEIEEEDIEYEELVKRTLKLGDSGHQVLVVQPYIKWGRLKKTSTTPELQLAEAVALIKSLPMWKVVDAKIISLMNFDKLKIFGKGNLEKLKDLVTKNKNITAVFISINMLKPLQQKVLEEEFGVPIFDRYTIVVQIFKLHATTKEAKIQVSMGEIPYMWTRLRYDNENMSDKMGGGATIGGPGETFIEIKKRVLQYRERKLKNELEKLRTQRELLRSKRKSLKLPTVAVVGYTNAGKTSLIKALTKNNKLKPRDILFATLDVTVHAGYLPSGLKVLFVDTVGFLADIPTSLIQSFHATLEDAVQSDLIIHVQDISHPDVNAQCEHVIQTLKSLNLPENLMESMITVANKIDVSPEVFPNLKVISLPVSSTLGSGIDTLKRKVEKELIKATGLIFIKIRVPNGGSEYNWLQKEATITKVAVDEKDNQFLFVDTLITESNLSRFKHIFITSNYKENNI